MTEFLHLMKRLVKQYAEQMNIWHLKWYVKQSLINFYHSLDGLVIIKIYTNILTYIDILIWATKCFTMILNNDVD